MWKCYICGFINTNQSFCVECKEEFPAAAAATREQSHPVSAEQKFYDSRGLQDEDQAPTQSSGEEQSTEQQQEAPPIPPRTYALRSRGELHEYSGESSALLPNPRTESPPTRTPKALELDPEYEVCSIGMWIRTVSIPYVHVD